MAVILSVAAGLSILFSAYKIYLPARVIVPKQDISPGTVIGENDVAFKTISRMDIHPMAVTDPRLVVGKYAREKLYGMEPVLTPKIASDPKDLMGVFGNLGQDETYVTFKQNEAKWPNGLRSGDHVSAVIAVDKGKPQMAGERMKVLSVSGNKQVAGQIDQIKNSVSTNEVSITVAMKWSQVGPLLYGKTMGKEIWILPEHPGKETGVTVCDSDFERIRKEILNEVSAAKRNTKI